MIEYKTIRELCEKEVLTVMETAKMLGLSRQRIYDFIKDGTYKPFRYLKYTNGKSEMPLLIKSEILAIEKRKTENKKEFLENHITTSLAKKLMKKRISDFIQDMDNGVIKVYNNVKVITGTGEYVNLKEFADYAKGYGICLDGLVTAKAVENRLFENGIFGKLDNFLCRHCIKPAYDLLKDKRYVLFNGEEIENAIKKEIDGRERHSQTKDLSVKIQ